MSCAAAHGTSEYTLTPMALRGGAKLVVIPVGPRSGYVLELRTRAGNDSAVCRPGVLIYKVDADVDTGNGPVTVYDSHRDSGGCTRSPNVQAELSDAPFSPGETFKVAKAGLTVQIASTDAAGKYRVYVTRR